MNKAYIFNGASCIKAKKQKNADKMNERLKNKGKLGEIIQHYLR